MTLPDSVPEVSVVIPTWRRADDTLRAVRSVLGQTLANVEAIVADDASGDGTPERIEAIGDPRARVLRQPTNMGACEARNRGIREARAPFVALLDSDDELLPESLERRRDELLRRPESPLIYSRVLYRLSDAIELPLPKTPPDPARPFVEWLVLTNGLHTSAMMARTEALRDALFDPRLPRNQDWDVALKLARRGPVAYLHEPLTRVHAENEGGGRITTDFDPERAIVFLDLHRDAFDASPRAEARVLYRYAMRAVRAGKSKLARDCCERTLRLDPSHRKARIVARALRFGLGPILPTLLEWRWRAMLRSGLVPDE